MKTKPSTIGKLSTRKAPTMTELEPEFDLHIDTEKFDTIRRKFSLDKNKDKLKQTEISFQVSLANCGDHHDEIILN